jgi:hypothetical protein
MEPVSAAITLYYLQYTAVHTEAVRKVQVYLVPDFTTGEHAPSQ